MYCRDGASPVRAYTLPRPFHSVLAPTPCSISSSVEERRIGLRVSSCPPACHPSLRSGSHALGTEILRCAQDDNRALSIPAVFWSTLAELLNEDVGVKGLAPSSPQHPAVNCHTTIFPSFKNNTSSTHTSPLRRRSHTISQCRAD